jgi:hypothetical protein
VSSAETIGGFNTGFDAVNVHRSAMKKPDAPPGVLRRSIESPPALHRE